MKKSGDLYVKNKIVVSFVRVCVCVCVCVCVKFSYFENGVCDDKEWKRNRYNRRE